MKIDQISLYQIKVDLKKPVATAYGTVQSRLPSIVRISSEGLVGWGEAAAFPFLGYNNEDSETVFKALSQQLIPGFLSLANKSDAELAKFFAGIPGNFTAKSGLEMAFMDLQAKQAGVALWKFLGGQNKAIYAGKTISASQPFETLLADVTAALDSGYKKVKIKISNISDIALVEKLRANCPGEFLALDANACLENIDSEFCARIDDLGLMLIEQPLASKEILQTAQLQSRLKTVLSLDESIVSIEDARQVISTKAARAINLKPARVGGLRQFQLMHDLLFKAGISIYCGGMFETGIGRAHALAAASLEGCVLPNDLGESANYFERDIIEPEVKFSNPGQFQLSSLAGIGYEIREDLLLTKLAKPIQVN